MNWGGRIGLVLLALSTAAFLFAPREPVDLNVEFSDRKFGEGVGVYLESTESRYPDIRKGQEKHVIWAGQRETRTPISVVYVHGFSSSSAEMRPVPERVAEALGANLFLTRLTGHGRDDPDAMAEVSVNAWMQDIAEAIAVGRAIGDRVLLITTSTGGTLAAEAAVQPKLVEGVMGIVFVSPNFGLKNPMAPLLLWPGARRWLPQIVGERRSFEPRNPEQAQAWTTDYPSRAVFPMGAVVRDAARRSYKNVPIPALFYFSKDDKIVRPDVTQKVISRWGGPVRIEHPTLGAKDDPNAHVIAGDILSPGNTDNAVETILDWVRTLH